MQGFDAQRVRQLKPQLILVATQGDNDEDALEAALRSEATGVLLVASRRKADKLRETMLARGVGAQRLAALHAPAGPSIHAHTPQEIALGAVAGLVTLRRELEEARRWQTVRLPRAARRCRVLPPCESMASVEPRVAGARYVNPVCGMAMDIASARHVVEVGRTARLFLLRRLQGSSLNAPPEKYLAALRSRNRRAGARRKYERCRLAVVGARKLR